MIYHLPFRDWLELNSRPGSRTQEIAEADSQVENGDGEPGSSARRAPAR